MFADCVSSMALLIGYSTLADDAPVDELIKLLKNKYIPNEKRWERDTSMKFKLLHIRDPIYDDKNGWKN